MRRSTAWLVIVAWSAVPTLAGGVAVENTSLTDNGDGDGYADTGETVELRLTLRNTSGIALTDLTLRLVPRDPSSVCVVVPEVAIQELAPGETLTSPPFRFIVADLDRTAMGLGPWDDLSTAFDLTVDAQPGPQPAVPPSVTLDLDLDVAGGDAPTIYSESFEDSLGTFEIQNLDSGLSSLPASDGYRCQYHDPDWVHSNIDGLPGFEQTCHLGVSPLHADAVFWGLSGPGVSPEGGRGFSGFHSLFMGIDLGPPRNWTTPLATLEAARTAEPIALAWDGASPTLTFKHQARLVDEYPMLPDQALDRGVVMVQLADDRGDPAGSWIKVDPYFNPYDRAVNTQILGCMFDPVDDGTTEDDFFEPSDPERRYGPSSTCYPERVFAEAGETSSPYDAGNVGGSDGPGLEGLWGIGTWVESRIDLSRFLGRSIRLRFLSTAVRGQSADGDWEELYGWNPDPTDDGWWIDDVQVTGALSVPASVSSDTNDNSGLPDPPPGDGDGDGRLDVCDNCSAAANTDQADQDLDGVGDACDPCPAQAFVQDLDADGLCGALDNCPADANPDQTDVDGDGAGLACDCDDSLATVHPGAPESNDGLDNQCPGDAGHGLVDEISGVSGFFNPLDDDEYSWPAQEGAIRYQVGRATSPDFTGGCVAFPLTTSTFVVDSEPVQPDSVFFYLVRAVLPNAGSWGQDSSGVERTVSCAP